MHQPGYLRDAFVELVEAGETTDVFFFDRAKQALWESMDGSERLWWLAGQLWHCTDVLPAYVCHELGIPLGSTYARAARVVR